MSQAVKWIEVELAIIDIEVNPDLQMRAIEPPADEYQELLAKNKNAWPFPPLRVIKCDGRNLLVEGFTRLRAAVDAGRKIVPTESRPGDWMDAVREACAANETHGYRRTSSDKRRAILRALEEGITKRVELAEVCRVSRTTVYSVIDEQEKRAGLEAPAAKKKPKAKPKSDAPAAASVSERPDPCPVCGCINWEPSDAGYVCNVCQYSDGEAAGADAEELEERVERRELIESGISKDLATARTDFGRLVRSLKKCGIDADRPLAAINKLITSALGRKSV